MLRYIERPITAIVRTDYANELIELPISPVTIATAEVFDADTGVYSAGTFINGPTVNSLILPTTDIWRLVGVAGPNPFEQPPEAIKHAFRLIVSYLYDNRGDVSDEYNHTNGFFIGTGARDLLRGYVRV